MLISLFLVSRFNFFFVPCGRLSWLPVSFLLHVKYKLSYRIVSVVWFSNEPPCWNVVRQMDVQDTSRTPVIKNIELVVAAHVSASCRCCRGAV